MDTLDSVIVNINDHLWTYLLIPLVVGAGLHFTVRSRGVQLRLLPEMFRVVKEKTPPRADGRKQVSSFGAFTISAAARVGTGNIVGGAFGFRELAAGGIGAAIQQGIRRGMFSNEAGLGSAPNAGAAAEVSHPVKQGLVQSLGVFFDTLLVCTMTAFIVLVTNPELSGRQGADLTQTALSDTLGGWAGHFLTVVVFMLAFSSMIGNYHYGETNIQFITRKRWVLPGYRVLVLSAVVLGSLGSVSVVWNLADVFMGLMALINLAAIIPLSAIAFRLLDDYLAQRRAGLEPVFTRDRMPDLRGVQCWDPVRLTVPSAQAPERV
ncbi:alanine/glycine:cation symporter family protein [Streptomyces sp. NPDC099050]|uniref:alanine/glycine:cation symporter family protein n=1 Tax=Streptomyces sp. NPDC099050 TaxID=3366100 RepID=UPI003811C16A